MFNILIRNVRQNKTIINVICKEICNKYQARHLSVWNNQLSLNDRLFLGHPAVYLQPDWKTIKYKHKKTKKAESDDEDEEIETFEDEVVDKHTSIIKVKAQSMRADVILKSGLGIARSKVEEMFYESKIHVNGKKLLKKSAMLSVDDEVDIVKGPSMNNPNFLVVSRIQILSVSPRNEGITATLKRNKSLTIENYSD